MKNSLKQQISQTINTSNHTQKQAISPKTQHKLPSLYKNNSAIINTTTLKNSSVRQNASRIVAKFNPFRQKNPFYLEQEEIQKIQIKKRQQEIQDREQEIRKQKQFKRQQRQQRQKDLLQRKRKFAQFIAQQKLKMAKNPKDPKGNNVWKDPKVSVWQQMGGLGPDIGSEGWKSMKLKADRMHSFSVKVKSINAQKILKQDRYEHKSPKSKSPNARQRAIKYSKSIPKPTVHFIQQIQSSNNQSKIPFQDDFSAEKNSNQLKKHDSKHEYYKNLLKKD